MKQQKSMMVSHTLDMCERTPLQQFLQHIIDLSNEVPVEYRSTTKVQLCDVNDDDNTIDIDFYYDVPLSKEEAAERIAKEKLLEAEAIEREARSQAARRKLDIQELNRLRAIYGDATE